MSIQAINLSHVYAQNTAFEFAALKDIHFTIESGEFVGLIGHTGSGKSTLIQHINRLLKPTSGTVVVDGLDINQKGVLMKDICKKVGIVFQYPEDQLFEDSVYQDISFGPKNLGFDREKVDQCVHRGMNLVGLDFDAYRDRSPFELSGGQKRRVAIAGVLAMDPDVLILDEPASGLDPVGRDEILDNIKRLHQERHLTIVLVSHSMDDVAELADKIMVCSEGKLMAFDTPGKVFQQVEMLEGIGLEAPQAKYLLLKLKDRGFDVNTDVYTLAEAKKEIIKCLKGVGPC